MAAKSISEPKQIRYLLGLCSPAERESIETQYFQDEAAFQAMLTAEDDLIDAYARDELPDEERRSFEKDFASRLHGRDRVKFARAFAGAVSPIGPYKSTRADGSFDIFRIFQFPVLVRIAVTTLAIILVALIAWLVNDRRRMNNELRELRSESVELSRRVQALQQSSTIDKTNTAEITAQRGDMGEQSYKFTFGERGSTGTELAQRLAVIKNDPERIPAQAETLANPSDATLGNSIVNQKITKLYLTVGNLALLTLQPAITRDQANITFHGPSVLPLNTFSLTPATTSSNKATIYITNFFGWIRFRLELETAAIHNDYRINIETVDGHAVTSCDWTEPLAPDQTIIDTPVVSTSDLPAGEYVLVLMGKTPDSSFVRVADYAFRVIE